MQACGSHQNTYGEGAAYYVGTQMDAAGLAKILDRAVSEVGVKAVIPETTGLEVTCRTSDDTRYYYVMNFKDEDQISSGKSCRKDRSDQ